MKITAKYLKKVFEKNAYALRDVSLDIPDGTFAVILGESGCGKSTLLRVIAGLEKPTAGELYLDGILADGIAAKDRNVAMVFQEYVLYPRFTVWENLSLALSRYHLTPEEEDRRIKSTLKQFELIDVAGQLPGKLSGGQQQRVALAKAVVTRPKAILFDEPLSNIAEPQRIKYASYIKQLKESLPEVTFLYVTHNLSEAMMLADQLIIMKDGRVIQQGPKDYVLHNPDSRSVLETICPTVEEDEDGTYNPYLGKKQRFDENCLIDGQKRNLLLRGTFDGTTLRFCDCEWKVDDNFSQRFFGEYGEVTVAVPTTAIHTRPLFGDIKLSAEQVSDNVFRLSDGTEVRLALNDFSGALCFSNACVELRDKDGSRVLAHYRVYSNTCTGRLIGKKLILPCGKIPLSEKQSASTVSVTFSKRTEAKISKKGITVRKCLDEEVIGNKKLCYCLLKGFNNYVALWLDADEPYITEKSRVEIDVSSLQIIRIR